MKQKLTKTTLNRLIKEEKAKLLREGFYYDTRAEKIATALGYDDLYDFLNDNPGAEEAIVEWVQTVREFRQKLTQEYDKNYLEKLGLYDLD